MDHVVDTFEPIYGGGPGGGGDAARLPKGAWKMDLVRRFNDAIPRFTDIFDEETFYLTAFLFVIGSCLTAFLLSRFITLRPID